jgi:hypothetical protein
MMIFYYKLNKLITPPNSGVFYFQKFFIFVLWVKNYYQKELRLILLMRR